VHLRNFGGTALSEISVLLAKAGLIFFIDTEHQAASYARILDLPHGA
jgi:hypothetical protein